MFWTFILHFFICFVHSVEEPLNILAPQELVLPKEDHEVNVPFLYIEGQKNIFMPPVGLLEKSLEKSADLASNSVKAEAKSGVLGYSVKEFRLTTTLIADDLKECLVRDPAGITYRLGIGDQIGSKSGEIIEISEGLVKIQETIQRFKQPSKTRFVYLKTGAEKLDSKNSEKKQVRYPNSF